MLLVLRLTQPLSHLQLQRNGHKPNVLSSRRCVLAGWMWESRSSSHVIPCVGSRPDRSPTRSSKHNTTRMHICKSATDAARQDDVDGQCPQSLMTSKWCPASNVSQWPRLGRGQAPCSCIAPQRCDTHRDTQLFGYREICQNARYRWRYRCALPILVEWVKPRRRRRRHCRLTLWWGDAP